MQTSAVNDSPSTNRLTPAELAAWRGMLRAHADLVSGLDAELRTGHELSLHEYEVLLILDNAPEQRLRMSDLAAAVVLSQSGLTRLVDRLVLAGAVERTRCETDRRGLNAELTAVGRARLAEARPTHLAGVRARFVDRFDEVELGLLAGFWERVLPGATSE